MASLTGNHLRFRQGLYSVLYYEPLLSRNAGIEGSTGHMLNTKEPKTPGTLLNLHENLLECEDGVLTYYSYSRVLHSCKS